MCQLKPSEQHGYNAAWMVIFDAAAKWVENGLIEFSGTIDRHSFCDFDIYLLQALGYCNGALSNHEMRDAMKKVSDDITKGRADLDWIVGPHGYALFKAHVARRREDEQV